MLEWKDETEGVHRADAGTMTVGVTELTDRWAVTVHDNDTGAEMHNETFRGTLEEAKRLAVKQAQDLVAPLIAQAVADERKAIITMVEELGNLAEDDDFVWSKDGTRIQTSEACDCIVAAITARSTAEVAK